MFLRMLFMRVLAPVTEDGLQAAISEAIEPGSTDANADTSGGESDNSSGDGNGKDQDQGGEGSGSEGVQGSGDPGADSRPRDEHGRFTARTDRQNDQPGAEGDGAAAAGAGKDGKQELGPDGKPITQGDGRAQGKQADHVNDAIPPEIKGKTRERIEGLIESVKTVTQERDRITAEYQEMVQALAKTGSTPEQFDTVMTALERINSDSIDLRRQGVSALRKMLDDVAVAIGETPAGKDPLEGHDDLLEEVESGDISRARAEEIARARNRERASSQQVQKHEQMTQAQREHAAAVESAKAELNTLGEHLRQRDPDYARKVEILVPTVRQLAKHLPPSQWARAYKDAYDALKLPPVDTRQRVPAGTGARQPARPKQGAGAGAQRAPQSAEEAIDLALQNMRA